MTASDKDCALHTEMFLLMCHKAKQQINFCSFSIVSLFKTNAKRRSANKPAVKSEGFGLQSKSVTDRTFMNKLLPIMDNLSQPLHDTLQEH